MSRNKYKNKAIADEKKSGGKPKQNNRHAFGKGNGKIGKKSARIKRAQQRQPSSQEFETPIKNKYKRKWREESANDFINKVKRGDFHTK
jgi:hypothetical protein